ncbi:hypothetical protein J6590_069860 [Homalodisca vitripennis]|nr:hypothetical protein J6590_069860 [Homalodisca vitripennis]
MVVKPPTPYSSDLAPRDFKCNLPVASTQHMVDITKPESDCIPFWLQEGRRPTTRRDLRSSRRVAVKRFELRPNNPDCFVIRRNAKCGTKGRQESYVTTVWVMAAAT